MSKNSSSPMTTAERVAISGQVKRVRHELGMKQAELAAAAGISRQTLSDIENGTRTPQAGVLRKVMGVLGIELGNDEYAEDTRMWLGLIGGVLDALPQDGRQRAGRAAFDAATAELMSNVGRSPEDDQTQSDYALAARKRAKDRGEDDGFTA